MLDDVELADWCRRYLNSPVERVLFRAGNLSAVVGVELADGRRAVVKGRPYQARIASCTAVQTELADAGFPCPMPLSAVTRVGEMAVTAERLVSSGGQLDPQSGAAPFARLLARLLESAPKLASVPSLSPSPPWAAWDHTGARVWPDCDDRGLHLNDLPGPKWLDGAARDVRERLGASSEPARIGHGDWESQNIRWNGEQPLVVHDWDSVIAQPEAAIVGLAAAVWPATGGDGEAASVAETSAFLVEYQRATGRDWSDETVRDAWAAGLWVRLFNAKKDAAGGGGPQLDRLESEATQRLVNAGLA